MGKVIPFQKTPTKQPEGKNLNQLKGISDQIDDLIIQSLRDENIQPYEIIGLLAHRLGSLLKHFEYRAELWKVCEQVLKKEACLD